METIRRAILDEINEYIVNAGEIFPIVQIKANLIEKNYTIEEIEPALTAMVEDGLLKPVDTIPHWKITEKGCAEF